MLKAKIAKLILACILFTSTTNIRPKKLFDKTDQLKWEKLYQIFIQQPQLQSQTLKSKSFKLLSSTIIGTAFWANISFLFGAMSGYQAGIQTSRSSLNISLYNKFSCNKLALLLMALPSMFVTRYAFKSINDWTLAKDQQRALRMYVENWEANKEYIPAKLIPLLDDTYLKYKENPNQVDWAEIARIIKTFIINKKAQTQGQKN